MEILHNHTVPVRFLVWEGRVLLLPEIEPEEKKKKWCNIAQLQVTGNDHNDHHGGKHHYSSGSSTLRYAGHSLEKDLLKIRLRDDQLEVVCHYQFYPHIRALRSWVTVTNICNAPVGLDYIASFSMAGIHYDRVWIPHNAWRQEVNWRSHSLGELGLELTENASTNRISIGNTGAWSTKEYLPMGALEGDGVCLWQIESGTSWHWEMGCTSGMLYLHLSGPTGQENGWHKELEPGASFTSLPAAMVFAQNMEEAFAEMTKYRRTIAKRTSSDLGLPVIFNDYLKCLLANPTTEKELPVIDLAAKAGAEYYVMDAGWYGVGSWWDTVGQWEACKERFPNGICEVFDYVRSKGMIPGIWLEIEVMGVSCPILDQFDDSCFFMRHGRRVIDHGRYQLDFRSEKVRRFATAVVDRLVGTWGVGYIKTDYNIEPGIGTEVNADSFGDGLLQHKAAYLSWLDSICEKYPDLIVESCSSGGMRLDYQMLAHHPLQSMSDQEDSLEIPHIAAAAATAALPEQATIWSCPMPDESDDQIRLNMVNAMLTRMHLSGKIFELSDHQLGIIRDGVALYKKIRGDISTSLPFYPCGLPCYDQKLFCAGYRGANTYLAVWRLDTDESTLTIPVCADQMQVLYGNAETQETDNGFTVTLPNRCSAAIIQVK